jgi:hypothetical protein
MRNKNSHCDTGGAVENISSSQVKTGPDHEIPMVLSRKKCKITLEGISTF